MNKKLYILLYMLITTISVHANTLTNIYIKNSASGYSIQYLTAQPIKKLYFDRFDDSRDKWKLDNDYHHLVNNGFDVFSRKDNASFTIFQMSVDTSTRIASGSYDPTKVFSDGSSSIFTGSVTPKKLETNENNIDYADVNYSFENIIPNGSVIITPKIKGKKLHNLVLNKPTYAYFGNIPLVEMENVSFITDPLFPKNKSVKINSLIKKIIDYHNQVMTIKLGFKPIVFISYYPSKSEEDDFSYSGDIINSQMHLTFYGNLNKVNKVDLYHLVSHELAHFWNAVLFKNKGPSWLHEGGADYFASQALLTLNEIDRKTYNSGIEKSLNICASRVGKYSISEADNHDDIPMIYNCGSFIDYTVDQLFGTGSAVRLWKVMLTNVQQNGGSNYGESDWFEALNEISTNAKSKQYLVDFITKPVFTNNFIKNIQLLGWKVDKEWLSEEDNVGKLSYHMFKDLMKGDCDDYYSFNMKDNVFNITNNESCKQLKLGTITKIDNKKIGSYSLYKDLQAKCENGQNIKITSDDNNSYSFICHEKLRDLLPALKIHFQKSAVL